MNDYEQTNRGQEPNNDATVDFSGAQNNGFKPKTTEDIAKEQKTRRTEKIIGAIGDGIMSLSNLFFASKGAPSWIGTDNKTTNGKSTNGFLTKAIAENHQAEDSEYQKKLEAWEKQQEQIRKQNELLLKNRQKEEEANRRVILRDQFGILERNWADADFIDEMYRYIEEANQDPNLARILDSFHYTYEPIWEWMGTNWVYEDGHDRKIDNFKGKTGSYMKRDLIETLFGEDDWTTEENRNNLINLMIDFEKNWIRIK